MRRKVKVLLPLLLLQAVITVQLYRNAYAEFVLAETFFVWGILDLFMALALIFGFENRLTLYTFTNSNNTNYVQNAANYIGAITKHFFDRERDTSAGVLIFILSLVNLGIYFVLTIIG